MRTQSKRGAGRASVGRFVLLPLEGTPSPARSTRVLNSNLALCLGGKFEQQLLWWLLLVYQH